MASNDCDKRTEILATRVSESLAKDVITLAAHENVTISEWLHLLVKKGVIAKKRKVNVNV